MNEELRRKELPGHDDHDLKRKLRDESVEAREESRLAEARWIPGVFICLPPSLVSSNAIYPVPAGGGS